MPIQSLLVLEVERTHFNQSNFFGFLLFQNECPAIDKRCNKCEQVGHFGYTCQKSGNKPISGHANAIRAYVERLSPNDLAVFNAQQIEKAENNGLVYNVETNDVENPENMTRHQRAGMFGHLN